MDSNADVWQRDTIDMPNEQTENATVTIDTPIGRYVLAAVANGLTHVQCAGSPKLPRTRAGTGTNAAARRHVDAAATALAEYFASARRDFEDLVVAPDGTPFELRVWKALRAIPYGSTQSYGAIARAVGDPDAARAVGIANNRNPIALIVPCHRVIGADGSLVGYAGGLQRKAWLLAHEGARTMSLFPES